MAPDGYSNTSRTDQKLENSRIQDGVLVSHFRPKNLSYGNRARRKSAANDTLSMKIYFLQRRSHTPEFYLLKVYTDFPLELLILLCCVFPLLLGVRIFDIKQRVLRPMVRFFHQTLASAPGLSWRFPASR